MGPPAVEAQSEVSLPVSSRRHVVDSNKVKHEAVSTLPLLHQDDREHRDQTITVGSILLGLRKYVLMLMNIAAWYTTNGMNGISMQSFARQHVSAADDTTRTCVTLFVTALQLLLGALLGWTMLYVYCKFVAPTEEPRKPIDWWGSTKAQTVLAALHAVGSLCTNLGFINGKASLVQVIKLFEPFETLFFTKLLIKEEGDLFTTGVVSSMCLTLGAALSLLPTKSKENPSFVRAIVFATLSGLSLSLRNVLQRRQHASQQEFAHVKDKIEKALILFTHISLQSGRLLAVMSFLLVIPEMFSKTSSTASPLSIVFHGINVGLLSWHPLYNAFSMITLGFVSAVTHSLLNAGKRVYAILMAILWFSEAFTVKTAMGLFLVTVGGCWYTVEMKGAKARLSAQKELPREQRQGVSLSERDATWWVKPLIVALLLHVDYATFPQAASS